MITYEVQPEIHVRQQRQGPAFSTCRECHHTFYPKNEDQHCLELCDACIEKMQSAREPVISVHVKARPRRAAK
jgi:hypothetical protein